VKPMLQLLSKATSTAVTPYGRFSTMRKRAILSVSDKRGIVDFARALVSWDWSLIASGGTAKLLRQSGLEVQEVADVTGAPEMLGGRVKTLHPVIHGGILARDSAADRSDLAAREIEMIDMVVCNLYPFEETVAGEGVTVDDAVEQIDIGGVALLRAAAKNYGRVIVVSTPTDYIEVLDGLRSGSMGLDARRRLAVKAFAHTRDYDTAIAAYLERFI